MLGGVGNQPARTEPHARRQAMAKRSTTVGLDVHKDTIDVVIAAPEADGEVRHFGTIGGDLGSVDRMLTRLRRPGRRLQFVYEAGPCGFHLHRHLTGQGVECAVVAPSMTPRRSGDRVKTDRRDAEALARLHRAGELRAIYVPTPEDEAIRDLVRAREDAVEIQRRARQRLRPSCCVTAFGTRAAPAGRSATATGSRGSASRIPRR